MTSTSSGPPPSARARHVAAPSDGLSLSVHLLHSGVVQVRAHGEVDLCTADRLRGVLTDAVDASPGLRTAVCDLSGVTFLAAIGVAALAEAAEAARRRGAVLHLVAATRPARRVLELCRQGRDPSVSRCLSDALDCADPRPPEEPWPGDDVVTPSRRESAVDCSSRLRS